MSIIIYLFRELPFLIIPTDLRGWSGLILWSALLIFVLWHYRHYQKPWDKKATILLIGFVIALPISNLFLGVRVPTWNVQPYPVGPLEPRVLSIMLFSALPWVLAAGLVGPISATFLAIGSGTILAFWDTHSPFTVFELASLAVVLSVFSLQRYRQAFHAALRQPFIATLLTSVFYPLLFFINCFFFIGGDFTTRLNYASTSVIPASIAIGFPLWIAGLVAQLLNYAFPSLWGGRPPWKSSLAERSILVRSFRNVLPMIVALLFLLIMGGWNVALKESEKALINRMESAAKIASEGIPYFLDTGQSLILKIADSIPVNVKSSYEIAEVLEEQIQTIPYFSQLFVIDTQGNSIGGYPDVDFNSIITDLDELTGIDLALKGFQNWCFILSASTADSAIQLSYITPIKDELGLVKGVLIGRTALETNPFARGILNNLSSLSDINGTGFILNEANQIIYASGIVDQQQNFPIELKEDEGFFEAYAPDGNRHLMYYQPTKDNALSVVLMLPARVSQQMALIQTLPFVGVVVLSSVVTAALILLSLRPAMSSLKSLALETDRIAEGNFGHNLRSDGVDELGQLLFSFEQMRKSLKTRSDEFIKLLSVSQEIIRSTTLEEAFRPILESGLMMGASSARILLSSAAVPETVSESDGQSQFGLGKLTHLYQHLDDQILALLAHQGQIVLPNVSRTSLLSFTDGSISPGSLMAVALRNENQYFGAFWIAYNQEHLFTREEVRFLNTLADQASLAIFSYNMFWSTEFDHQRLMAILASTPDSIIVIDQNERLYLVNSIAQKDFGIDPEVKIGQPIGSVIHQPDLIDFIQATTSQPASIEVVSPDGRDYLATASMILVDEVPIGKVCVLRDITQFKELDAMKSIFVATVSHDLRSSLTMLRGYTTMLTTVGELNKQQESYTRKILTGVESMSRLINNLLDLGRIETETGLRLQTLPVHDIFEEVINTLQMKAHQKKVQIHFEPEKLFLPLIEADHAMLHQAFINLLDNAIKFSPDGKDVWIKIRAYENKVVFSFQDQGIGISGIDKPRLFEKFFRSAQRDVRRESGSGLGLAIVKSVAERHGGRVWVESQLGKGSTFFFEIPIRQQKDNQKRGRSQLNQNI